MIFESSRFGVSRPRLGRPLLVFVTAITVFTLFPLPRPTLDDLSQAQTSSPFHSASVSNSSPAAPAATSTMDESIPSTQAARLCSRCQGVSQAEIEAAKARRDEEWKAAYARLFEQQEEALNAAAEEPTEDVLVLDGGSFTEKLAANRATSSREL